MWWFKLGSNKTSNKKSCDWLSISSHVLIQSNHLYNVLILPLATSKLFRILITIFISYVSWSIYTKTLQCMISNRWYHFYCMYYWQGKDLTVHLEKAIHLAYLVVIAVHMKDWYSKCQRRGLQKQVLLVMISTKVY